MSTEKATYVFNQYYWDLLKRTKDAAKNAKASQKIARDALRSMKKHYMNFDKLSEEHKVHFIDHCRPIFDQMLTTIPVTEWQETLRNAPRTCHLYKDIPLCDVASLNIPFVMVQFFCFMGAMTIADVSVEEFVQLLKDIAPEKDEWKDAVEKVEHEPVKALLLKMGEFQTAFKADMLKDANVEGLESLEGLENTSLGKLAKEIMNEVDLSDLQQSFSGASGSGGGQGENGGVPNILEMLQNPNGGISKLLSTVSTKMISKLSSGEISQETLLQDAMSFASKLPNMMPPGMNDMGNILQSFMGAAGAGSDNGHGRERGRGRSSGTGSGNGRGGFDMSMMQNMMKMMGNMGGSMPTPSAASMKHSANKLNHEMRRRNRADKLRKKVEEHRRKNVESHVEEPQEENE